jgi:acyl carrier protein
VSDRIREILNDYAGLPVDASTLDEDADLFQSGMTSHASLSVMLALEDAFDIEFPDQMLRRNIFSSVSSISRALNELGAAVA